MIKVHYNRIKDHQVTWFTDLVLAQGKCRKHFYLRIFYLNYRMEHTYIKRSKSTYITLYLTVFDKSFFCEWDTEHNALCEIWLK